MWREDSGSCFETFLFPPLVKVSTWLEGSCLRKLGPSQVNFLQDWCKQHVFCSYPHQHVLCSAGSWRRIQKNCAKWPLSGLFLNVLWLFLSKRWQRSPFWSRPSRSLGLELEPIVSPRWKRHFTEKSCRMTHIIAMFAEPVAQQESKGSWRFLNWALRTPTLFPGAKFRNITHIFMLYGGAALEDLRSVADWSAGLDSIRHRHTIMSIKLVTPLFWYLILDERSSFWLMCNQISHKICPFTRA